jgi:hypothetical protein
MVRRSEELDSPFRRAMLYVIQQLGEVSVVKLEKILYLADLEHFRKTGGRITGAKWIRHRYGPMAKATLHSKRMMEGQEITVRTRYVGSFEATIYGPGPRSRFQPGLTEEQRASLDRIIALTRPLSAKRVTLLAYNTTPMLSRLQEEAETGQGPMWDVTLPFDNRPSEIARSVIRHPTVTAEELAAFKAAELERVDDLQRAAVAHSTDR